MDKYLVCIDLDSTFLKDDKSISDYAKEYVTKFVNKGNFFIINTGRPHQGAVEFLKELNLHLPLIANNGSAIVEYDENYEKITNYITFDMDAQIVKDFYDEVKDYLNTCAVTSIYDLYSPCFEKCPFFVLHPNPDVTFHEGHISELLTTTPIRSEYFVKEEFVDKFIEVLNKEKYTKHFSYTHWGCWEGIHSFEISSKEASKGKAMEFLAKKLGIKQENTFAFGDQLNDLSMIEFAHDGVAMSNAREEVKLASNHITKKDNNDDGVISYLEELNLI